MSSGVDDDNLADLNEDDFVIFDEFEVNSSSHVILISNSNPEDIKGNLKVSVDDRDYYDKNISIGNKGIFTLCPNEISQLPVGNVILKVQFTPEGKNPIILENKISIYDFKVYFDQLDGYKEVPLTYTPNMDVKIKLEFDKQFRDKINYTFLNKTYNVDYSDGSAYFTISTDNLDFGTYNFEVNLGNQTRKIKFDIKPSIFNLGFNTVDKDYYISFFLPKSYSGTGYVYYCDENENVGDLIKQENAVNGIVTILMPKLQYGTHLFMFKFNSTNFEYNESFEITTGKNNPNITVSVNSGEIEVGDTLTVEGKSNGCAYVILVNESIVSVSNATDSFKEVISGLNAGKYRIAILAANTDGQYYDLFYVTVKEKQSSVPSDPVPSDPVPSAPVKKPDVVKLTLKKVIVKRSAKKLTIQATLKVNGKAPKRGSKITFKFKGKKYIGKTNAKGVAKITVKKSILKKLKKGKKVTYTATYSKVTKKVTVKVRK